MLKQSRHIYQEYRRACLFFFFGSVLTLMFSLQANAQIRPDFFPEEIVESEIGVRCYCKPGVRYKSRTKGIKFTYTTYGSGTLKDEDQEVPAPLTNFNNLEQFEFDMKAPIVLRDNFNLIVGFKLFKERFGFDQIGADYGNIISQLRGRSLRSGTISIFGTKPLNETKYLVFALRYASSGNSSSWLSFDKPYQIFKFYGAYAIKESDDKEWGFGLNISKSFRRTTVVPFMIYNKNFNTRWGIEAVFPGSMYGRYNFGKNMIGLFGVEYGSKSFRIQEDTNMMPFDYAYNHSEVTANIKLERRLFSWIWAKLRTGYIYSFNSDFESKNANFPSFQLDPTNGLYIQLGVFISPQLSDANEF